MPAIARCQMPPWPVPEAFSLPAGLALMAAMASLQGLVGRVGAHLEAGRIEVHQRDRGVAAGASVRSDPGQCIIVISTVIMPIV
jgi:hypothetical protein